VAHPVSLRRRRYEPLASWRNAPRSPCIQYRRKAFKRSLRVFSGRQASARPIHPEGLLGPKKGFLLPLGLTGAGFFGTPNTFYEVCSSAFLVTELRH